MVDDVWLTYAEAADAIGCHISRISKLVIAGASTPAGCSPVDGRALEAFVALTSNR